MPSIRLACNLSSLDKKTPSEVTAYANFILELLLASGEVELVEESEATAILSLDGRFRPGRRQFTMSTLYDLGHLLYRQAYSLPQWIGQSWRVASTAHRSDHLLAPSEAIVDGLRRWLRVDPERITLVEPLPAPHFYRRPAAEVEAFRQKLQLPSRYFLFIGGSSRPKNLKLLSRAWQLVSPQLNSETGLVVIGGGSVPGARNLDGLLPTSLPLLLSGALAWVCPSFYEGCAIGAMEAMACGAPPLVSPAGALARAVEGAGLILDPEQPEQWAKAMLDLTTNSRLRATLSAAGRRAVGKRRAHPPQIEPLLAILRQG